MHSLHRTPQSRAALRRRGCNMYIDVETINTIAKVIGSLAVIGGVLAALYKFVERDKAV